MRNAGLFTVGWAIRTPKKQGRMKLLWQRIVGEDLIQVRKHAINLISCPNPRRGAKLALEIAADLAREEDPVESWTGWEARDPFKTIDGGSNMPRRSANSGASGDKSGGPVLYINGYAGEHLLAQMLRDTLEIDESTVKFFPEDMTVGEYPTSKDDDPSVSGIPLALVDCETGALIDNIGNVRRAIEENKVKTVILNSFEFSCFTQREREKVATELRKLQQKCELTLIVVTSYSRKTLQSGMMCPGPIGLLAAYAETVSRVTIDNPSLLPSQKLRKQKESATVHENETLAPDSPKRLPPEYRTDILPNERLETDEGFDENVHWSGEYLSKLAFTPLLKAWYAARPYEVFPPGGRPTEEGLMMVEAAKVEWARMDAKSGILRADA